MRGFQDGDGTPTRAGTPTPSSCLGLRKPHIQPVGANLLADFPPPRKADSPGRDRALGPQSSSSRSDTHRRLANPPVWGQAPRQPPGKVFPPPPRPWSRAATGDGSHWSDPGELPSHSRESHKGRGENPAAPSDDSWDRAPRSVTRRAPGPTPIPESQRGCLQRAAGRGFPAGPISPSHSCVSQTGPRQPETPRRHQPRMAAQEPTFWETISGIQPPDPRPGVLEGGVHLPPSRAPRGEEWG